MKTYKQAAMVKRYILPFLLFLIVGLSTQVMMAQENITMYNMRTLPQTNKLNPAFQTDYNGHVGGYLTMITPIFGQAFPNLDINVHNSFAFNDFIYEGDGIYSDSLVWALNSQEDALNFIDQLEEVNSLSFDMKLNLLNFGFRTDDLYWTFHALNKTAFSFNYPRGLFELLVKGNMNTPRADLSGIGVDAINYMEYGLGVSADISDFKIGGRVKALAGIANLETVKSDIYLNTNTGVDEYGNTYAESMTIENDIHMQMSQPFVILDQFYYDNQGDSLVTETTEQESDQIIDDLGYDFSNPGVAFDIGAEYNILPEFKVYTSITDLGFIKWNTNVAEIKGGGKYDFNGFDMAEFINDDDDDTEEVEFSDYGDSLTQVFKNVKKTNASSYRTWLPTKFYLGSTYNVTNAIGFGALYRGTRFNDGRLKSAFSLSANANTDHISFSLTYTMMDNHNFDNIGLGFAGRVGPFQVYLVSDHVLEEIFPHTAEDVNIRMGLNWVFGTQTGEAALLE